MISMLLVVAVVVGASFNYFKSASIVKVSVFKMAAENFLY